MSKQTEPLTREFSLLLACARVVTPPHDAAAIREMLDAQIDWTQFARKALDHGLAGLVGHTLARVAPDLVPHDILAALSQVIDRTRKANIEHVDELARVTQAFEKVGIETIAIKGPVLAIQAFGDLGLRVFNNLEVLVRDFDGSRAVTTLGGLGYERRGQLTPAQFELVRRLQGKEIFSNRTLGSALELHTRLTPMKMALDIDYAEIWRRAGDINLNGHRIRALAPEDDLLSLAIEGGQRMWWNVKWSCDIAASIASHADLDWTISGERARAQGCLRMLLLATSLARQYFGVIVPDAIISMELADPAIETMVRRIVDRWRAGKSVPAASGQAFSLELLRLHDGFARRSRYAAQTLFLPGAHDVAALPLPKQLTFAYLPIKIAYNVLGRPLSWSYRRVRARGVGVIRELANSDLALAVWPASSGTRLAVRRHQETCATAKRLLATNPDDARAWYKLANGLFGLRRYQRAIACYDRALAIEPDSSSIWKNRRAATAAIGKKGILQSFEFAPDDVSSWTVRAGALWYSGRLSDAVEASDRALEFEPENLAATRIGIHCRLQSCDWRRREDDKRQVTRRLTNGSFVIKTIDHRALCDSEEELRMSSRLVAGSLPRSADPLWHGKRHHHDRLRVAYVSADLHSHAVANAIVGCFEEHDKTRFETIAISTRAGDRSGTRQRIEAAFDHFIDAYKMSDTDVAEKLRELEADIAVDLTGYTGATRSWIFAHRPAPLQVNFLGYSGTMDAPFIDYIIADKVVIPPENQIHYSEKVVYLPNSYFPSDEKRAIATKASSRVQAGLPETSFVFACFNQSYKIGPEVFAVWMRLLKAVEGSVLWLKTMNPSAIANLQREAHDQGVAAERLVFARRAPLAEDYLAQLWLADLYLDTLPYNAHAMTSDALWVDLPVVTCLGHTFPARVAGSLLFAIGLPELVTKSLAEYEALALLLAREPERLAAIKDKLKQNRKTESLFDTKRFTRNLESAYTLMWQRYEANLQPASFDVADAPDRSSTGKTQNQPSPE